MKPIDLKTVCQKVADNLQTLVDNNILGSFITDEGTIDLLTYDYAKDPAAVLQAPAIEQVAFDTSHENMFNLRFDIPIVRNGANITEKFATAGLITDIIKQFDMDPTLKGAGDSGSVVGQSQPATVEHFTLTLGDKILVVFVLTLKYTVIGDWR